MSLRDLKTPAMVAITSAWLDPTGLRPVLLGLPTVAPLVPTLQSAHAALLASQPGSDAPSPALQNLQDQEAQADARYDRKLRGIFGVLTGLAELSDDAARAHAYLDLRDALFPQGLTLVNAGYAAESGEVAMVDGRLSADHRALLGRLMLPEGPLQAEVDAWKGEGQRLGALEQQKAQLPGPVGPTRAQSLSARNGWIAAVNAVRGVAEVDPTLDDAKRKSLFGQLDQLSAQGARRHHPADAASASDGAPGTPAPGNKVG